MMQEENDNLRKRIRELEQENANYLNTIKESSKNVPLIKAQMDKYKEYVQTLLDEKN